MRWSPMMATAFSQVLVVFSVLRRGELHAIENSAIPTGAVRAAVHLGGQRGSERE